MKLKRVLWLLPILVIGLIFLSGFVFMEEQPNIEDTDAYKYVVLVINMLVGAAGMPISNVIKKVFKVEDKWALTFTILLCLILGILIVIASGLLTGQGITFDNMVYGTSLIFSVAYALYRYTKPDTIPKTTN